MSTFRCLKAVVTCALVTCGASAIAAPIGKGSSASGGKSSGRDWLITLPLFAGGALHAEYNAGGTMGLALEYSGVAPTEELLEEEILLTGNSLAIDGMQVSVLMSRYSDERNMGGFFWTLGTGYRVWTAEWKKRPGDKEITRLSLVDDDGYLHHRVQGKGVTGHGRFGYRYVASEWPLAVGLHLGLRHMNSEVTDVDVPEKEEQELSLTYSEITEKERKHLKHKMMTRADISLDFGFVF